MKFKKYLMLVVVGLVLFLVACGGAAEKSNTSGDEASNELEGNVAIDGSGTVYPLMSRLAEEYMVNEQPNVSVEVSRAGTSAGFEKFLVEDGTDFNDASRVIKDEEASKSRRAWN